MSNGNPPDSEPILFEQCDYALLSHAPEPMVQSLRRVQSLVLRAHERGEPGKAVYQLDKCKEIDAGAILLLMHAGAQLAKSNWQAFVSGSGEAINLVARHLEHYLREPSDRGDCERNEGDYLLRSIAEPELMVEEIAEWARSVQQETNADREDVALWEFQISEVATNGFQHGLGSQPDSPPMLVAGKAAHDGTTVQLAALDFGRSIPATIGPVADDAAIPSDDGKRIRFACKKGITSRAFPVNQGAGLHNLVETVKKNGGKLIILSGNGLFHVSGGRCYSRNLASSGATGPVLEGTLTVVNLRVF